MESICQLVVFSNKAYNALIRESFEKDPVETGGILLGHILDNGVWIVMEVLPPGIKSTFQYAYFEYDEEFVNYLAQSVANQYKRPLDLLGLWHRHPGSMDHFSATDDATNMLFARQNPAGVISGLVNIDPRFRLTMYHLGCPNQRNFGRPHYQVADVEVGDDIIPEEYFELRYYGGEISDLHPFIGEREEERVIHRDINNPITSPQMLVSEHNPVQNFEEEESLTLIQNSRKYQLRQKNDPTSKYIKWFRNGVRIMKKSFSNKTLRILLIVVGGLSLGIISFKSCITSISTII